MLVDSCLCFDIFLSCIDWSFIRIDYTDAGPLIVLDGCNRLPHTHKDNTDTHVLIAIHTTNFLQRTFTRKYNSKYLKPEKRSTNETALVTAVECVYISRFFICVNSVNSACVFFSKILLDDFRPELVQPLKVFITLVLLDQLHSK